MWEAQIQKRPTRLQTSLQNVRRMLDHADNLETSPVSFSVGLSTSSHERNALISMT